MPNEIMEEVWRNRDDFAKACNYDLTAMVERLRELEREPLGPVVSREEETQEKNATSSAKHRG